jgi:NAD(P)-dependent dehydrogenase (short-subunit alcohol dehydrogenase family)
LSSPSSRETCNIGAEFIGHHKKEWNMSQNKAAIVTAAGRGMGAATARELASAGYQLALLSNSGGAESLAQELGGISLTGSVTEVKDLEKLVGMTMEAYGRIDAVVNNTGHPPKGPLLEIPDDAWHLGLDIVLMNVVRMARLVTPIMLKQGSGAIVNISTFAAFEPSPAFPVSSSLRAALASFAKLYADQYAVQGIRMNNVLPGFIDSYPESEENLRQIPLGRYGKVGEIASTVRFLLSDEAGYITGQNIRVDGGITRAV